MEVIPTGAALGAEVSCGDLRRLDTAGIAAPRKAWLDHLVVLVHSQEMSDADLVAFGRGFGDFQHSNLLLSPLAMEGKVRHGDRDERHPEVAVVSNIVVDGVVQGRLGDGELVWHTDLSSFEASPNQTILHSIEVPPSGGNTGFSNMYLACDTLPLALRTRVGGLMLKHDATIDAAGYVRKQFKDAPDDLRISPGAVHPLVRTHPETGCNCLFLGWRAKQYLMDLTVEDSEALLDELWAHATRPQLEWFHQ
jgi:taurine dioxygenase